MRLGSRTPYPRFSGPWANAIGAKKVRMRRATPGRIEKVIVEKKIERVIIITIAIYGGLLVVYIYMAN